MNRFLRTLSSLSVIVVFGFSSFVSANDLDDGISRYNDDPIGKADQLGSSDINFNFIEMQAKAEVGAALYTSESIGSASGLVSSSLSGLGDYNGSINSVTLYPGSAVYGDIIIVDTSTGDKTQYVIGDKAYTYSTGDDLDIKSTMSQLDNLVQ